LNVPILVVVKKLFEFGKTLREDYFLEYLWREVKFREIYYDLLRLAPVYRDYIKEFFANLQKHLFDICSLTKYIFSLLFSEVNNSLKKYGNIIVMDRDVVRELISGSPRCDEKLCRKAFQWWLSLKLFSALRSISSEYDIQKRCIVLNNGIMVFFDSKVIQEQYRLRPDVLSLKISESINLTKSISGRVIEMKLSWQAFQDSIDQIQTYQGTWGKDSIVVTLALPAPLQDTLLAYITRGAKVIDALIFVNEESIENVLKTLLLHLLKF